MSAHHDHHHHHHHDTSNSQRRLLLALVLTALYAVVEAVGGIWSGSLALVSDAGHMVTDVAALGLALFAQYVARRPASSRNTYGYARAEVLGALINSLLMLAMVGWIGMEAIARLMNPKPVNGVGVMAIAVVGLLVNMISAWLLSGDSHNMNSRAALMHVLGDLLGSVAAILAGLIIWATGWLPIDPLLSLLVVCLIIRSAWTLVLQSSHMLMEGVPAHIDPAEIGNALARQAGVKSVHDLHVWHLGPARIAMSAHVIIDEPTTWPKLLATSQALLSKEFGITHVTLQPVWATVTRRGRVIPLVAAPAPHSSERPREERAAQAQPDREHRDHPHHDHEHHDHEHHDHGRHDHGRHSHGRDVPGRRN